MKPKRGRPPRTGELATRRISIRVTDDEYARFHRLARINGYSVADVVRVAVANTSRDGQEDPEPLVLGDGRVLIFHR